MASISTFDSLRIRDYRLLWLGQVNTSMGQWMDQVTRGWLIYQITGSPLQLGLVTATRGLPLLLFGILAGAFADRSGRKMQLIVAQVVNGFLNLFLALLVLTGYVEVWHIYLTAFLSGSVQAFQQPARQTLISDLVPENKLLNALALNSAALNSSRAIGPAVAGVVITFIGTGGSYMLQAVMYAVATIWTYQINIPARLETRDEQGRVREHLPFFRSVGEGLAFAGKEPNIRAQLLLGLGPLTFAMSYTALMPLIAVEVLDGNATLQETLLSFVGGGALIGALTVASMRQSNAYGLSVVLGAVAFCVSVLAFASSHWVWVSCALGFVLGLVQRGVHHAEPVAAADPDAEAPARPGDEHLPARSRAGAARRGRRRHARGALRRAGSDPRPRDHRARHRRAGRRDASADPEAPGTPRRASRTSRPCGRGEHRGTGRTRGA